MDITLDLRGIRDLEGLSRRIGPATERALDRAAQVTLHAKQRTVRRTYARAIPRRKKSGKPMWKRSGDLLNGQTIESRPGERSIVTQGNAAKYEGRLANLNTGADGINRTNKAAEDAHRIVEPQLQAVIEQVLENELGI